jgi:hypothetical protein
MIVGLSVLLGLTPLFMLSLVGFVVALFLFIVAIGMYIAAPIQALMRRL